MEVDRDATIQAILDKCKKDGTNINMTNFNAMLETDGDEFLIDSSVMFGVKVIYKQL
jgi:hypothetical protein